MAKKKGFDDKKLLLVAASSIAAYYMLQKAEAMNKRITITRAYYATGDLTVSIKGMSQSLNVFTWINGTSITFPGGIHLDVIVDWEGFKVSTVALNAYELKAGNVRSQLDFKVIKWNA